MRRRRSGKLWTRRRVAATASVAAVAAAVVLTYTMTTVQWTDSNPEPLPIILMARADGIDWWVSVAKVQVSSTKSLATSIPDSWGCYELRARFVNDKSETPLSAWSNTAARPVGCTPTRYVPEPGGLAMLAGLGLLGLMKWRK